jgi:broad specificity phosphatase PhoE
LTIHTDEMPAIVLIRHGRSGHVHTGWIDVAGFVRWREAYEAAGIDPDDMPPAHLRELVASAGVVVSSTARRAVESARALAPGREVLTSPLLEELELRPPRLGPVRLPLGGWALAVGIRLLICGSTRGEQQRRRAAAQWLAELAEEHGRIVVVTHASFRSALARKLVRLGWRKDAIAWRPRHWSAWSFTSPRIAAPDSRPAASPGPPR